MLAEIGAPGEKPVHIGDLELLAAERDTFTVQPADNGLDAHQRPLPPERHSKNAPDRGCLSLVDHQALLDFRPPLSGGLGAIAEGWL
ncbi:hypothetical protein [Acidiphilium sp.]|uniref:hypothetical protein n=1 Tax=Acidiphilium sp. TaxID=527 RepID=UPI00258319E3|nr:hypothetical protein [Acidiphilium sp.]